MGEKRGEVGIGLLIVDDKAGIDGRLAHHHRMAVAADAAIGLEQGDPVALASSQAADRPEMPLPTMAISRVLPAASRLPLLHAGCGPAR
jgi:hypothetical protein